MKVKGVFENTKTQIEIEVSRCLGFLDIIPQRATNRKIKLENRKHNFPECDRQPFAPILVFGLLQCPSYSVFRSFLISEGDYTKRKMVFLTMSPFVFFLLLFFGFFCLFVWALEGLG